MANTKLEKKADDLFRDIIRAEGKCRRCKKREFLQCAHIVSRGYRQVRWDKNNAMCLCKGCHVYFTHRPIEWEAFVIKQIGAKEYKVIKVKAIKYGKINYAEVIDRLSSE